MPTTKNSLGSLEVNTGKVDSGFLMSLNDRMRRVGLAISQLQNAPQESGSGEVSQVTLTVPGILAVQQDVCPVLTLGNSFQPSTCSAFVKRAPIGSNLTLQLYVNGVTWGGSFTIAAGTLSTSIDVSGNQPIPANQIIRLDIVAVGALLTGVSFPGSDLSVFLRV